MHDRNLYTEFENRGFDRIKIYTEYRSMGNASIIEYYLSVAVDETTYFGIVVALSESRLK